MSDPPHMKQSLLGSLKLRGRAQSPQPDPPHRERSFLGFLKPRGRSRSPQPMLDNPPAPSRSTPAATDQLLLFPTDNPYLAAATLPSTALPGLLTRAQQVKEGAGTVFEGLKTVIKGLYDCSDMFLPLKTGAGVFLSICNVIETMSGNKKELEDLQAKLTTILAIVKKYQGVDGLSALNHRIKIFCDAMELQLNEVQELTSHSLATRAAEGTKDADKILKAFRNINSLCDVFQIDTQLHIERRVEDILQRLNSGSIDLLRHGMTSYKTRYSSYGDPSGCMPGTREKILADLEAWALNEGSSKVYWLVGMAGTGKSTISQTFCEILDRKNMLGASFFCSRAAEETRNARCIIPSIAYSLARASPLVEYEILKAIMEDPALAEWNYNGMSNQFSKLVCRPIRMSVDRDVKIYKVIVIDALDECNDIRVAASLIRIILESVSSIPLKVFIASRDEAPIRNVFNSIQAAQQTDPFILHEVEKETVEEDIKKYVKKSLAQIVEANNDPLDTWPLEHNLSIFLSRCGTLFIYAATAMRYIDDEDGNYRDRFSAMACPSADSGSRLQTAEIDDLYAQILERACNPRVKEPHEVARMRETLATVIFVQTPLSMQGIAALLKMDVSTSLSAMKSLIHVPSPTHRTATVTAFHASFPDFVADPMRCTLERCPSFPVLVPAEEHGRLALKCLEFMNHSLKYNICGVPEDLTVSRMDATNLHHDVSKISEALRYACLYWASHFSEMQVCETTVSGALHTFLEEHLLHWMECLSILGELQAGIKSLESLTTALSHCKTVEIPPGLLAEDALRFLQLNFECIKKHCLEVYQSALVWIPTESVIRKVYAAELKQGLPRVMLGLPNCWSPASITIQTKGMVTSVAFSQDGSRVISGSGDETVRIWNAMTGEMRAELEGHTGPVNSVAFSQDSSRIVSGSDDKTVRIWNAMTGEMQAELKGHAGGGQIVSGSDDETARIWNAATGDMQVELEGHTGKVNSVAFSQDSSRVVSGSGDKTVRIWSTATGEMQAELKGHTGWVKSVVFSQDGSRVVSGSNDKTVRIWKATTGEMQAKLEGHTDWVYSVAFSQDGSRVVSGSDDKTVRVWNATTGEMQAELEGHTGGVNSVAFSQDSSRVVSGSDDETVRIWSAMRGKMQAELEGHMGGVRIWNATTGKMQAELKGHTSRVKFVAFSKDGSRVVSGSDDETVRIWNAATGEMQAELEGHTGRVNSVAFSQDGSRVVSGSNDKTVRIWKATTGEMQAKLEGHTDWVYSVAFSQDGSRVVSGSDDETVRIWNATTGEMQAELKGHTSWVKSVAFSQDGSRVVSGSNDETVRIWNATTGEMQAELEGHTGRVNSVTVSQDGSRVIPGSDDRTIRIWNPAEKSSFIMDTFGLKLPDSTQIHCVGLGGFHIVYPADPLLNTHALSISQGFDWILGTPRDCWIPPHYRDSRSMAISRDRVCFGYLTGRVIILNMAPTM
ncbi:Mycorrhiza-induced WD40-repeat domain protein [Mycena venus]|uniref:Mycorrhiza-induced WD40-repeat domain protein n=1 Tax=Mycena venus TaxID=2733690 RepID=A0A8H6XPJ9_9AGAR|nr:Mycorrhiza-induced WD40-repeat domain protein [Mycena venus]